MELQELTMKEMIQVSGGAMLNRSYISATLNVANDDSTDDDYTGAQMSAAATSVYLSNPMQKKQR